MDNSQNPEQSSSLRGQIDSLIAEPGRDYKTQLVKCVSYVRWHLNHLESYLRAKDGHIEKLTDMLEHNSTDSWISIHSIPPELGKQILLWNEEFKTFEAACLNSNMFSTSDSTSLLKYLKENHYTHWQRVAAPIESMDKAKLALLRERYPSFIATSDKDVSFKELNTSRRYCDSCQCDTEHHERVISIKGKQDDLVGTEIWEVYCQECLKSMRQDIN